MLTRPLQVDLWVVYTDKTEREVNRHRGVIRSSLETHHRNTGTLVITRLKLSWKLNKQTNSGIIALQLNKQLTYKPAIGALVLFVLPFFYQPIIIGPAVSCRPANPFKITLGDGVGAPSLPCFTCFTLFLFVLPCLYRANLHINAWRT